MSLSRSLILIGTIALIQTACSQKADSAKDSAGSGKAQGSSVPEKSADTRPWVTETGRGGAKCEFVAWQGAGKDRIATFKLTMPKGHDKDVSSIQTWEFYYDKSGKQLSRYPHATSVDGAGPVGLGEQGDSIPKDTDAVECEITRIIYNDKKFWFNANLVVNSSDRPKGGVTDETLKASSGEKVTVEVTDPKKGHIKLKNVSDKEIKSVDVDIIYLLADGTLETRLALGVALTMKPGETVEKDVKIDPAPPAEFKSVEGTVPSLDFADEGSWANRNLEGPERPTPH